MRNNLTIDALSFRTVAAQTRPPHPFVSSIFFVQDRAMLPALAGAWAAAQEQRSADGLVTEPLLVSQLQNREALRVFENPSLPWTPRSCLIEVDGIPDWAVCEAVFVPPNCVAYVPGLFAGSFVRQAPGLAIQPAAHKPMRLRIK